MVLKYKVLFHFHCHSCCSSLCFLATGNGVSCVASSPVAVEASSVDVADDDDVEVGSGLGVVLGGWVEWEVRTVEKGDNKIMKMGRHCTLFKNCF